MRWRDCSCRPSPPVWTKWHQVDRGWLLRRESRQLFGGLRSFTRPVLQSLRGFTSSAPDTSESSHDGSDRERTDSSSGARRPNGLSNLGLRPAAPLPPDFGLSTRRLVERDQMVHCSDGAGVLQSRAMQLHLNLQEVRGWTGPDTLVARSPRRETPDDTAEVRPQRPHASSVTSSSGWLMYRIRSMLRSAAHWPV
jgi:hypothetical protein